MGVTKTYGLDWVSISENTQLDESKTKIMIMDKGHLGSCRSGPAHPGDGNRLGD